MSDNKFDSIPSYEPLAGGGDGEGPGIGEDLDQVKPADLVGVAFAVIGYLILPSTYPESTHYAIVEIMDANGDSFKFLTSSKGLLKNLRHRYENNQLPFRTSLEMKPGKRGSFYVFT